MVSWIHVISKAWYEKCKNEFQIIEEIVKKIENSVSETSSISKENKEYLKLLKKKLTETPNDESDKTKVEEIDEKETDYLQKSLQFMISGNVLTFSDEKRPISEFHLNKNNGSIQMILNLSRRFKDSNIGIISGKNWKKHQMMKQMPKIEEIDEKDTDYLQKSLPFMFSGNVLAFSDEKKSILNSIWIRIIIIMEQFKWYLIYQ